MRSSLKKIAAIAAVTFISISPISISPASASLESDLTSFWSGLGGTSNITAGTSFAGQSAGYYTLGNVRLRAGSRDTNIFSFSPPDFAAGCGGIDFFSGSLSFISKDELVALSKAIAANAVGYAFDLALETISPVIAETLKNLRAALRELNLNNINSCETAQGIVDTVIGKDSLAANKLCQRIGSVKGLFTDYAGAAQECGNSNGDAEKQTKDAVPEKDKQFIVADTNLAWQVMRGGDVGSTDWLKADDELAQLAMTMTGTIVFIGDNERKFFPAKAANPDFLKLLLEGGELDEYYKCATKDSGLEKCLVVDTTTLAASKNPGFIKRVTDTFNRLEKDILLNRTPDPKDIAFVNSTEIPVWRILNVLSAGSAGTSLSANREPILNLVAFEYMFDWVDGIVAGVYERSTGNNLLKGNQFVDDWILELREVQENVRALRNETGRKFLQTAQIIQQIQYIDSSLSAGIGANIGDIIHGGGS